MWDLLIDDLKSGVRQCVRRPGLTVLVVMTLALGLLISTAVFTYVGAYSRPFPGANSEGLRQVYLTSPEAPYQALSFPDFEDLKGALEDRLPVAGVGHSLFAASVRHEHLTEVAFGQAVTGSFFLLAGVEMALGRGIMAGDDQPGAEAVVVISDAYWAERYGRDANVLGRSLLLNNEPYTIVGVAGPTFLGASSAFRPQVWLPFEQYMRVYWARSDNRSNREAAALLAVVRPGSGISDRSFSEALTGLAEALDGAAPLLNRVRRFRLEPATWISPETRAAEAGTSRILQLGAVALLLLACANVSSLVMSAGERRGSEMALRSALGASRPRLLRQLLTESVLLALLAGGAALALAGPLAARLGSYFARPSVWGANVPRVVELDVRVMAFAFLLAMTAGVGSALIPALRAAVRDPASGLASGPRPSPD